MIVDKFVELIEDSGLEAKETEETIDVETNDPFELIEALVSLALEDDDEDETLDDLLLSGVIRGLDYAIDEDGTWTLSFKKDCLK